MSRGHVNRGMLLVKAMPKRDRADFFEEVADGYCIDCGEELPDEDAHEEHDCPEADDEDEGEDAVDEAVFEVVEAAHALVEKAELSVIGGQKMFAVSAEDMERLKEAFDALKVAEAEDDAGDDDDPDAEDEGDEEDDDDDDT